MSGPVDSPLFHNGFPVSIKVGYTCVRVAAWYLTPLDGYSRTRLGFSIRPAMDVGRRPLCGYFVAVTRMHFGIPIAVEHNRRNRLSALPCSWNTVVLRLGRDCSAMHCSQRGRQVMGDCMG